MSNIIVAASDSIFISKIVETARQNQSDVFFVKTENELLDHLSKYTRLVIFDLNNENIGLDIIKQIKSNRSLSDLRIIGFVSHLGAEKRKKATDLGFDKVYARLEFSKKLPEII